MRELEKKKLPEPLEDIRPHPLEEEYNPPNSGGCWICYRGNGWEEPEEFEFSTEFDTFFHPEHLEHFKDVNTLLQFEMMVKSTRVDEEEEEAPDKKRWEE